MLPARLQLRLRDWVVGFLEIDEIEKIETDLLLDAIYRRYGHDFRGYARTHLERRIRRFLGKIRYTAISELIPKVLHEETFFEKLALEFSITVTEMFRDPFVYRSIREKVVPFLRTYPFIRVWIAGCSTGEEAYSLAIVLKEEGLLQRSTIFATDFNDSALQRAREGVYAIGNIRQFTENYQQGGGIDSFSKYYHAHYGRVTIDQSLKERIVFANHNLATDAVFNEVHLILCRNVLIYFDQDLQDRVLTVFSESLTRRGFLCLGTSEEVQFSKVRDCFKIIDNSARIFQLTGK
jgi:chemotaxis protein methyltransferase CheR